MGRKKKLVGMLYGPNTNLGHNSIILMIEAQSRYINALISPILSRRRCRQNTHQDLLPPISLRPDPTVLESFNRTLQSTLQTSAFADPNCQSWYKNEQGLITNNWSGTVVEYQKILENVVWSDYIIEGDDDDGQESQALSKKGKSRIGRVREETVLSGSVLGVLGMVAVVAVGVLVKGGGRTVSALLRVR
jgi:hypothetical protein